MPLELVWLSVRIADRSALAKSVPELSFLDGLSEGQRDVGARVRRGFVVGRVEGRRRHARGVHRERGAGRRALVAVGVVVGVGDPHVDDALGEVGGGVDGDDGLGGVDGRVEADVRAAAVVSRQREDAVDGAVGEVDAAAVRLDRLVEGQRDVRRRVGHRGAVGRVEGRRRHARGVHREGGVGRRALVAVRIVVPVGHRHVDVAVGEVRGGVDRDDGLGGVDAGRVGDVRAAGAARLQRQDRRQMRVAREVRAAAGPLDRLVEGQRDVGPRVRHRGVVERIEGGLRRSRGVHRERRAGRRALVAVGVVVGVGDPHVDDVLGQVGGRVDGDDRLGAVDGRVEADVRAAAVVSRQRQDAVDGAVGEVDAAGPP